MPDTPHAAGLRLVDLRCEFGDVVAVDGIELDVRAGEFVTLLGPSGSGKTTTLNMIAGFVKPTAGQILRDGKRLDALPAHRRNLGMVFQQYALFPHMTVFENVAYPLRRRRTAKDVIAQRVADALALVRLHDVDHRYPGQLSGGQQQRVAVARALVFEPDVLLMDEPLGALDKGLREWLQGELKRIHSELGITFLYVTHDQEEALALSDRIALFNAGRIEQVGTADDLYERPTTLFAAQFLGESNIVAQDTGERSAALVLRPERAWLESPLEVPKNGEVRRRGLIREVSYGGWTRRFTIEVPDGPTWTVRTGPEDCDFNAGQTIDVCWNAADTIRVHASPAAS